MFVSAIAIVSISLMFSNIVVVEIPTPSNTPNFKS